MNGCRRCILRHVANVYGKIVKMNEHLLSFVSLIGAKSSILIRTENRDEHFELTSSFLCNERRTLVQWQSENMISSSPANALPQPDDQSQNVHQTAA